jgi:hypothetical protein
VTRIYLDNSWHARWPAFIIELKALKADFTVIPLNNLFDYSAVFAKVTKLARFLY